METLVIQVNVHRNAGDPGKCTGDLGKCTGDPGKCTGDPG